MDTQNDSIMNIGEKMMLMAQMGNTHDLCVLFQMIENTRPLNWNEHERLNFYVSKALMLANCMGHTRETIRPIHQYVTRWHLNVLIEYVQHLCALIRFQRRWKELFYDPDYGPFINQAQQRYMTLTNKKRNI